MKKMSTDARKVINKLIELTGSQEVATAHNVLVAESLCYSFYSKTIMGHMSRFYNPDSKSDPTNMEFYYKPVFSINKGRRNKEEWPLEQALEATPQYMAISAYVDVDFNYDALKQVKLLAETYSLAEVNHAIKTSGEANVYSVPFLARVLESERAENIRIADRRRRQREVQEESLRGIHQTPAMGVPTKRSPIDIANLAMGWEETINTMELENKLKEIGQIDNNNQ